MKFGLMFANAGPFSKPENALGLARLCEDLGFESLWTVEHVVVPSGYESAYPYSPDGKMPGGEHVPIPDPLTWLAFVAGATTKIRLGTGILILPQRNPLILAKEVATLDRLSGGRVELGVGVGWLEEEFDALGVPWAARGRRTDEYIDVLRKLWREPEIEYDGEFVKFAPLKSSPKPARDTGVPIHVGGHTMAAARRAGRSGDGFFPGRSGDELGDLLAEMRRAATEAGRDADEIEITSGGGLDLDAVKSAADLGVSRYIIPPLGFDLDTLREQLGRFSENVIARA
ncbi:MAG TPA: LLM class F420-dependent oxidoreductase [Acidimicrobiia bacterium]|nr:LLM class F420-dependent oxidoreductase [Acidimicrobiia bacterium]